MKKFLSALFMALCAVLPLIAVPVAQVPDVPATVRPTIKVGYAPGASGENILESPLWEKLPSYQLLRYVTDINFINMRATEPAAVKYLYNGETLFVRAEMTDSDIMTTATKNHGAFYLDGDVFEVFIKPLEGTYYWEYYGTPNKLFTCYFFPSRGRVGLLSTFDSLPSTVKIYTKLDGTFNMQNDRDRSWTVVVAIRKTELEKHGAAFGPGHKWLTLAARYNYTRFMSAHERASYPQVTRGFHSTEFYANMEFINLDTEKK